MRRLRVSMYAWVVAAALGGCAAGEAEYGADVRVTSPELVAISPGVQVIADADDPVFYADGYYWLYRDNVWLRSDSYRGGFARIDVNMVPSEVRTIDRPSTYAHYSRHHQTNYARGGQMQTRTQVRPQVQPQQAPVQQQQQTPTTQPYDNNRPMGDQRPMGEQRPGAPGTTPTEPMPSTPYQKPPVPNAIPGHEGAANGDMNPTLPSQRHDDLDKDRDHDNNANKAEPKAGDPDRKLDKTDHDRGMPDKTDKPDKPDKSDRIDNKNDNRNDNKIENRNDNKNDDKDKMKKKDYGQ
jgi:hypothetical protein